MCMQGGEAIARRRKEDRRMHLEPMLERCGFAIEDVVYSQDGIFGKYVARAT